MIGYLQGKQRLILKSEYLTKLMGQVVRKPVYCNPGLKVNRSIHFSFIKMFFTAYVSCTLRLFKLKTKEQTI